MSGLQLAGDVTLTVVQPSSLHGHNLHRTMTVVQNSAGRLYARSLSSHPTYYIAGTTNLNQYVWCRPGTNPAAAPFGQGVGDDGYYFFDWDKTDAQGAAVQFVGSDAQWTDEVAMKDVVFTKSAYTNQTSAVGARSFASGTLQLRLPTTGDTFTGAGQSVQHVQAGRIFIQDSQALPADLVVTYDPATAPGAVYDITFAFTVNQDGSITCPKTFTADGINITRHNQSPVTGQTTVITLSEDTSTAQLVSVQQDEGQANAVSIAGDQVRTAANPVDAATPDTLRVVIDSNILLTPLVKAALETAADHYNSHNIISDWSIKIDAIKPTKNGADNTNNTLAQQVRYLVSAGADAAEAITKPQAVVPPPANAKVFKANTSVFTNAPCTPPYLVEITPIKQNTNNTNTILEDTKQPLAGDHTPGTTDHLGRVFGLIYQSVAGAAVGVQ